jgi:hypothetical protein
VRAGPFSDAVAGPTAADVRTDLVAQLLDDAPGRWGAVHRPSSEATHVSRSTSPAMPPGTKKTTRTNSTPSRNNGSDSGIRSQAGRSSTAGELARSVSRLSR